MQYPIAVVITHEASYGYTGAWDAVVTCFFIDTAHNIVEYIEIISQILKDGGVSLKSDQIPYIFIYSVPLLWFSIIK